MFWDTTGDWVDMNTQVEQRLGQNRTVTCL